MKVHEGEQASVGVSHTSVLGVFCNVRPTVKERQQCAVFALRRIASCS